MRADESKKRTAIRGDSVTNIKYEMKHLFSTMILATGMAAASAQGGDGFKYTDEQFADLQMLRYKVEGFDKLSLKEKTFIY